MEAIQPASERTRTITVTTRKVVEEKKGEFSELSKPESVFIRPLPFRRWPKAIGHITRLLEYMPAEGLNLSDNTQMVVFIGTLLAQVEEDLFSVIELATDKTPEFFDTVDPDDGIKVIAAVVEHDQTRSRLRARSA
jgi:hypothetical protein